MNWTVAIMMTLLLVGVAIPAASHSDVSDNPYKPKDHSCTGIRDFLQHRSNAWTVGLNQADNALRFYVHMPPHDGPDNQDPGVGPGILWLENNDFQGLQKGDFVCSALDGSHDEQSHSDLVLL